MQRVGNLERPQRSRDGQHPVAIRQLPSVDQHPDRFHGIEGHSFGALQHLLHDRLREPRDEATQQRGHCLWRQRFEVQGGE